MILGLLNTQNMKMFQLRNTVKSKKVCLQVFTLKKSLMNLLNVSESCPITKTPLVSSSQSSRRLTNVLTTSQFSLINNLKNQMTWLFNMIFAKETSISSGVMETTQMYNILKHFMDFPHSTATIWWPKTLQVWVKSISLIKSCQGSCTQTQNTNLT